MSRVRSSSKSLFDPYTDETPAVLCDNEIAVIYTGGTIGMVRDENDQLHPDPDYLIATMKNTPLFHHKSLPKYHIKALPPFVDSAHMNLDDIYRIANFIQEIYDQYAAFVIIQGTDTMAYTASLLSFILVNLTKPVIITGSQLPLSDPYSDGYFNLVGAIRSTVLGINEVCVFFCNKLMRGNRVQKYSAWDIDAFNSATLEPIAIQGCSLKVARYITNNYIPIYPRLQNSQFHVTKPCKDVAMMIFYPGFQPQLLRSFHSMKGLVIQAYGSGNGPSGDELLKELKELHQHGCVIAIATQTYTGQVSLGNYQASSVLQQANCISSNCMTPECAFSKLCYLFGLGLSQNDVEQYYGVCLRGEFEPVGKEDLK